MLLFFVILPCNSSPDFDKGFNCMEEDRLMLKDEWIWTHYDTFFPRRRPWKFRRNIFLALQMQNLKDMISIKENWTSSIKVGNLIVCWHVRMHKWLVKRPKYDHHQCSHHLPFGYGRSSWGWFLKKMFVKGCKTSRFGPKRRFCYAEGVRKNILTPPWTFWQKNLIRMQ